MHESTPDSKWHNEGTTGPEISGSEKAAPEVSYDNEAQLIEISLLMRLYDIGMAILSRTDSQLANEIFDAHARGEVYNPPIAVPDFSKAPEKE